MVKHLLVGHDGEPCPDGDRPIISITTSVRDERPAKPAWVSASWVRRRLRLNLLCRRPVSGTTDLIWELFSFGKGQLKTEIPNLIIPPPQDQYRTAKQVEQPASAAYRAMRGCGYACPRGRATWLVWASPEGGRP